ncbi:PEGA domain-containing protein [bacterium]|nr:PEGA domain-containing protein [bacterium]MCK4436979.1 PEGA domain-containing protein [bacterium]
MFHGSTQMVSIRSNVDDAKLYVNEAYIGTGNGVTTFRKNKNYTIVARKEGYADGVAIPTKSFDATTLLGVLLDFGIISILVVDGICTGAWQQFDQTSYVVDPQEK